MQGRIFPEAVRHFTERPAAFAASSRDGGVTNLVTVPVLSSFIVVPPSFSGCPTLGRASRKVYLPYRKTLRRVSCENDSTQVILEHTH